MYCLRCGKDTAEGKVFCQACLDSMEAYPVKPGQPIVLPNQPAIQARKKKVKPPSTEELLDAFRRQLRRTRRLWLITILLLLGALGLLFLQWQHGLFLPTT